jgi:hypothetical protein
LDGFSIILSKTPNYLNGDGGYLGYFNIVNSLVLEVDLNQNPEFGDISANSLSVHRCYSSRCTPDERTNTIQKELPFVLIINLGLQSLHSHEV